MSAAKTVDFKTTKYKFYHDPGHGWLAVPKEHLRQLGIADKISQYSYEKGNTAYLEEDCDATTFIVALRLRIGNPEITFQSILKKESYSERSPIRSYAGYGTTGKEEANNE